MSRHRPDRPWLRTIQWTVGLLFTTILLAGIVLAGYGLVRLRVATADLPSLDALSNPTLGGITRIYATDRDPSTGKNFLLGQVYERRQEFLPIAQIPDLVQEATIAIEDERFYSHTGVDFRGIFRAVYRNVREKRLGEGASTLTQQLARNLILHDRTKTVDRKLREAFVALQIEQNLTKDQILERYLNEVCYGNNTFGIKAAARVYFGRPVDRLTLPEVALLVGIPQRPTDLEPFGHRDAAIARRNLVLDKMRDLGFIPRAQAEAARASSPKLLAQPPRIVRNFRAPYFTTYVLQLLEKKYGEDLVRRGGLTVYTSLHYLMQKAAERTLLSGMGGDVRQGALVCLDPHTGYIRSMVGGVDFNKVEYNAAVQGHRQPGSTFKVIVYTAAFDLGKFSPDSEVYDGSFRWNRWRPKNYDGRYHGSVDLESAIAHSYNIPAVKVGQAIGLDRVIEYARRLGIQSKLSRDGPLTLGASAVTPMEMATAFSVFANQGNRAEPQPILSVYDNAGNILEENKPRITRSVIGETTAMKMERCLRAVVRHGTAASADGIHEIEGACGKTGTTSDNRDAWFVGYTPELTAAVWVCGERWVQRGKKRVRVYPTMDSVTGGHVCAPIWARFMKEAVPLQRAASASPTPRPSASPAATPTPAASPPPGEEPWPSPTPETVDVALDSDAPPTPAPPAATLRPTPAPERTPAAPPTPAAKPIPAPAVVSVRRRQTPAPTAPPAPREIALRVCPDSGRRATRWCPETILRTFPLSAAPRGLCTLHRPRPGDE